MYWIYDIPAEFLGLLFAFTFASFAVAGVFITRKIRGSRVHEEGWQEHVVIVLEGAFAFFGLLLALVPSQRMITTRTLARRQQRKPRRSGLSTVSSPPTPSLSWVSFRRTCVTTSGMS